MQHNFEAKDLATSTPWPLGIIPVCFARVSGGPALFTSLSFKLSEKARQLQPGNYYARPSRLLGSGTIMSPNQPSRQTRKIHLMLDELILVNREAGSAFIGTQPASR